MSTLTPDEERQKAEAYAQYCRHRKFAAMAGAIGDHARAAELRLNAARRYAEFGSLCMESAARHRERRARKKNRF